MLPIEEMPGGLREYLEGQERDFRVRIFGTVINDETITRVRAGCPAQ